MKVYVHESGRSIRHHSGAALVITLAMLILVSFVVVAFLGRSTREAVLVSGAVGGQEADLLASSAAEMIIADLKNEMRAGSTITVNNDIAIMEPNTSNDTFPSQNRLGATSGTAFVNLLKQSGATGGIFPTSATYKLISNATITPTTTASVDGRTVSAARWNAPQLLVGGSFGATQVPNWILIDRAGIAGNQTWNNSFKDRTPTNNSFIIGRFAYNIYDMSGLLDINVAGYPDTITATSYTSGSPQREVGRKGGLAMSDIGLIPGITSRDDFVAKWRNLATKNSNNFLAYNGINQQWNAVSLLANDYYNFGPKYGFQKVVSKGSNADNSILNRQDLIKLATNGNFGISTAALPYLTHFSRAVSAPSWSPTTSTAANRFLPNVRVPSSGAPFTRADGTAAQQGEPLLKTRFPLSRLALLQKDADPSTPALDLTPEIVAFVNNFEARRIANGGSALGGVTVNDKAAWLVQLVFGLTWSSDRWNYAGPSGSAALSSIATLGSISGREPNFFELLKAAILSGSLGKSFGDGLSAATANQTTLDSNTDRQIIQIGLNIIDQYDGDSYPTVCLFNGEKLYGIENLPYLNRVFMHFYRPPSPGPTTPTATTDPLNVNAYWIAEVWNPHRGTTPNPSTAGPSKFRFSVIGDNQPDAVGITGDSAINSLGGAGPVSSSGTIDFNFPTVSEPQVLLPPDATSTEPLSTIRSGFLGIYAGTVKDIPSGSTPPMSITSPSGLDFILEYEEAGTWKIYQQWSKIKPTAGLEDGQGYRGNNDNLSPACFIQGADPRSTRFGLYGGILPSTQRAATWDAASLTPLPPCVLTIRLPSSPSGWTTPTTSSANLGDLSKNIAASTTRYNDPDGVLRGGDAANSTAATDPLLPGITNSRPVILNRPFRSVAELGYAFRDLPFKSLDLFSDKSADSALLDVFCVNESSASGVTAGVLNPNTRHEPVIRAVLVNSLKDELDPATGLTISGATPEVPSIASTINSTTTATPIKNSSELATRIVAAGLDMSGTDEQIKARRESVVRALADVSNTRTWNVMVDLVVQSGRYASAATDVDKFTVDGERRMWVHLAIDRYTGQVIARSTEVVNE